MASACSPARNQPIDTSRRSSLALYRELDHESNEVRLLVVQPGTGHEMVRCSFQHAFLGDRSAPYETISYVWGDATLRKTILLEGREIDVPASSERVLRRMRLPDATRVLWLDAVCIDQKNLQERADQVAMMGEIYARTTTNLIWLGEEDNTTESSLCSIKALYNELVSQYPEGAAFMDAAYPSGELTISTKQITVERSCLPADELFRSSWFTRLWVCQEASLAPRSICHQGSMEIPLDVVMGAVLWRFHRYASIASDVPINNMNSALYLAEWTHPIYGYNRLRLPGRGNLLELLFFSRNFQAADPRDHIFALVGQFLAISGRSRLPLNLLPDYTLSLAEVSTRATRFAIIERGDLNALKYVSHRSEDELNGAFASWVPRWDRSYDVIRDAHPFYHIGQCADAGMEMDVDLVRSGGNVLTVTGRVLDRVEKHISAHPMFDRDYAFLSTFEAIEDIVREGCRYQNMPLDDLIGLTLQAGVTSFRHLAEPATSGQGLRGFKAILGKKHYFDGSDGDHDYRMAYDAASCNRQFFKTTEGYVGLGPGVMRQGDLLTVLRGARFPVILRPVPEKPDEYQCLGEAYVHGIMNGEAVREPNTELSIFKLC